MPCDSRITSSVEWTDNTDPKLLAAALKSLGFIVGVVGTAVRFSNPETSVTGTYDGRKKMMTLSGLNDESLDLNPIKRAYSAQVIQSAAKRFGWQVKQTDDTKFQITRRV